MNWHSELKTQNLLQNLDSKSVSNSLCQSQSLCLMQLVCFFDALLYTYMEIWILSLLFFSHACRFKKTQWEWRHFQLTAQTR